VRDALADELEGIIRGSAWFMQLLEVAQACDPPDWWVGAGVLRDLVWDTLHGGFDPARVKDVDLAFFDPADLSRERDQQVERELVAQLPSVRWDAKNQAAVHTWYARRFGYAVEPLPSSAAGVATWPETATAVAVRLHLDGQLELSAPWGLHDLLRGVCRRNPERVSVEEYHRRLEAKQVASRWPRVRIIRSALVQRPDR
jgi:hypothetical protein